MNYNDLTILNFILWWIPFDVYADHIRLNTLHGGCLYGKHYENVCVYLIKKIEYKVNVIQINVLEAISHSSCWTSCISFSTPWQRISGKNHMLIFCRPILKCDNKMFKFICLYYVDHYVIECVVSIKCWYFGDHCFKYLVNIIYSKGQYSLYQMWYQNDGYILIKIIFKTCQA